MDGMVPPAIVEQRGGSGCKCPPAPPPLERVPAGLSAHTELSDDPPSHMGQALFQQLLVRWSWVRESLLPTALRVPCTKARSGVLRACLCMQVPRARVPGMGHKPLTSLGEATDSRCRASRCWAAKPRVGFLTRRRPCLAYLPRGVLLPLAVEELLSGRFQRELFPVKLQVWGVRGGAELRVFLGRHRGRAPPGKASS